MRSGIHYWFQGKRMSEEFGRDEAIDLVLDSISYVDPWVIDP